MSRGLEATTTPQQPPESGAPGSGRKSLERLELQLGGLHCAGCVATVEDALRRVSGVEQAVVNLATERAFVQLADPAAAAAERLVSAVKSAGYEARLIDRHSARPARGAERAQRLARQRTRLVVAFICGLPLIVVHMGMALRPGLFPASFHAVWHSSGALWLQALLALATVILAVGDLLSGAVRAARHGNLNMDVLVTLGAGAAYCAGLYAIFSNTPELLLFESAAMIGMFVGVGKHLEARARGAAVSGLESLAGLLPTESLRRAESGDFRRIPTEYLQVGDVVRVPVDSIVPADGELLGPPVAVDESLITGEGLPVSKQPGDRLLSGTRVAGGVAELRTTATGADSTTARIGRLVEDAMAAKPAWQRLADRAAARFTPVVLLLALATFVGWLTVGNATLPMALTRAIAVLVVACPCAMGLAIPMAVMVGTSAAARRGILVRNPEAFEVGAHVQLVLLDKTGTLTLGRPVLTTIKTSANENEAMRLAAGLAALSTHPLSKALLDAAQVAGLPGPEISEFHTLPGRGILGTTGGQRLRMGAANWLVGEGVQGVPPAAGPAAMVDLAADDHWLARFEFADELRAEAAQAVRELHTLGIQTRILSGDRPEAVSSVAEELGVDSWRAGCLPADKLVEVQAATKAGTVAFVGDGVNDAPALAAASIGFAIGTGAEVSRETAGICLVGRSPLRIAEAIQLARRSTRIMRQNLGWAVGYNLVMLPLAIFSRLPAEWAAAAMMLSSISVVTNSLRLRKFARSRTGR